MANKQNMKIAFTWPKKTTIPKGFWHLESCLEELISRATCSIDILSYTYNTDINFILNKALITAIKNNRGNAEFKIRFFLDKTKFDETTKALINRFNLPNVDLEIWYWQGLETNNQSKFHVKSILVHPFKIYLGSANWSNNAVNDNAEYGLFFSCRDTTKSIKNYLKELIDQGLLKKYEY